MFLSRYFVCLLHLHLIHLFWNALQASFITEVNTINTDQAAPAVACNISYPSTLAVERDQATIILNREKGLKLECIISWQLS